MGRRDLRAARGTQVRVTTVLDAHGVTALANQRRRVAELLERGEWPPIVPAAVLIECLTGDHHRDFHANRFLRSCAVQEVTEVIARHAALLRTRVNREGVSVTDAVVAATADHAGGGIVLTSDLHDLEALASASMHPIHVAHV